MLIHKYRNFQIKCRIRQSLDGCGWISGSNLLQFLRGSWWWVALAECWWQNKTIKNCEELLWIERVRMSVCRNSPSVFVQVKFVQFASFVSGLCDRSETIDKNWKDNVFLDGPTTICMRNPRLYICCVDINVGTMIIISLYTHWSSMHCSSTLVISPQ